MGKFSQNIHMDLIIHFYSHGMAYCVHNNFPGVFYDMVITFILSVYVHLV